MPSNAAAASDLSLKRQGRRKVKKMLLSTQYAASAALQLAAHGAMQQPEHDSRARDIVAASRVMEVIPLLAP